VQELTEHQVSLDATLVEWPEVRVKPAFGHRGYVRNGKMFAFMADEGVGVKAWAGEEVDALYALEGVRSFEVNGMAMRAWPILPLRSDEEISQALTALQHAYERAVAT
jgi:hypothetical protein